MTLRNGLLVAIVAALALLLVVLLTNAAPIAPALQVLAQTPAGKYNPAGLYVGPSVTDLDPLHIVLNRQHIPVEDYAGLGYQQNPAIVAQYGLKAFSRYVLHRRPADRAAAVTAARWLIAHQQPDGRWLYLFPFEIPGGAVTPPWPSALAQGQAMSLLERVYRLTRQHRYLAAALRALSPLDRSISRGGLQTCFERNCRLPFFQEYVAGRKPVGVLNGFMFTLIGLYDLSSVAPNSNADQLYMAGRRTLATALPRYNSHGLARYDLISPQIATQEYQAIHVYLLHALSSLTPSREYMSYASLWRRNLLRAPQ